MLYSSALDAFCAGIPVIIYLDFFNINFSPLRELPEVQYFNSAVELDKALENTKTGALQSGKSEDFFWLDSNLPRWKKLLKLDPIKEDHDVKKN